MDLDSNTLAGYYGLNDQQAPAGNALSGNLINNSIDNPISFPSLDSPLGGSTRSRGQKLMGMGGGADLPTKLRALGAMFSNQVPEFRQQMMQENEAESRLAVQLASGGELFWKNLAGTVSWLGLVRSCYAADKRGRRRAWSGVQRGRQFNCFDARK